MKLKGFMGENDGIPEESKHQLEKTALLVEHKMPLFDVVLNYLNGGIPPQQGGGKNRTLKGYCKKCRNKTLKKRRMRRGSKGFVIVPTMSGGDGGGTGNAGWC